jgi:hypothetical protein
VASAPKVFRINSKRSSENKDTFDSSKLFIPLTLSIFYVAGLAIYIAGPAIYISKPAI